MGGIRAGVDTRSKVLSLEAALRLSGRMTLASGYFDVLRAEDARELEEAGRPLLAVVLRHTGEVVPASARAEMVAAIRVVDYVVTADHDDLNELIARLQPVRVVRLEAAHAGRIRRLIDDVQRSQTR